MIRHLLQRTHPILRAIVVLLALFARPIAHAQDADDPRPRDPIPRLETFETDEDGDGVPDGWYNLRDARMVPGGVEPGKTCLRFENDRPGRPSRISRAFGVDGRKVEAIIVGLWVRQEDTQTGDRLGEDPGMQVNLLGPEIRTLRRGTLGPWTRALGTRWRRVSRRIPVPPEARDAILSVGQFGATGVLEIDKPDARPGAVGGKVTTNLIRNGDLEMGDPDPVAWMLEGGARRATPGYDSANCLELTRAGAKALVGLGVSVQPFAELSVSIAARGLGLKGGGTEAFVYFLDPDGRPLPGPDERGRVLKWTGTFEWSTPQGFDPRPRAGVEGGLAGRERAGDGCLAGR